MEKSEALDRGPYLNFGEQAPGVSEELCISLLSWAFFKVLPGAGIPGSGWGRWMIVST